MLSASSDKTEYVVEYIDTHEKKRKVREEAQLLANRIALLQKEEERTKKMIDDTKVRAGEIMKMREETERKLQGQIAARRQEEEERQSKRRMHLKFEQKGRRLRSKHAQEILKKKKESVDTLRHDKLRRRNESIVEVW